jgi:DNA-binding MarR family transcriptional regulator
LGGNHDGLDLSDHTLTVLISVAERILYDAILDAIARAGFEGIRRAHGAVYEAIDPGGSRLSDMAERVQMRKQSMGELVDHLESHGYVERLPDPHDGRAKLITLTKRGEAVARTAIAATNKVERRWERHLGDRRARDFRRALEDICATFGRDHIRQAAASKA